MVQRYVWWDEIQKHRRVRLDVRAPEPMVDVLREVAKKSGVSVNGLVVGILAYAVDPDRRRFLRVEVIPSVRVSDNRPEGEPVAIPVLPPTPSDAKRWKRH
ncbi:MAG: hypothetical protein IT439_08425 [Phycisphaerales bacterium]|nr:hypothetical protein [Phycisphaerales bacterium]